MHVENKRNYLIFIEVINNISKFERIKFAQESGLRFKNIMKMFDSYL